MNPSRRKRAEKFNYLIFFSKNELLKTDLVILDDQLRDGFHRHVVDVEPAEEGLLAEPGELTLGIATGGLFEKLDETVPVLLGLLGLEIVEALPIPDRL